MTTASTTPSSPGSQGALLRAFRHREFKLLWIGFVASQMGFWISHISMQSLLADLTGDDPAWIGWLFFAVYIPSLLLSPIAGVVADRVDRKRILVTCYLAVLLLSANNAVFTATDMMTPGRLLGFGAVFGAVLAFMGPAAQAVVANSVPPEDLASAISLQAGAGNLTRVVGPMLAAPVLAGGGADIAFAVYAVAMLIVTAVLLPVRLTPYTPEADGTGVLARMADGLHHARERQPALAAIVLLGMLSIFGVAHTALVPTLARTVLGQGKAGFTGIVAATGFGAMVGALVVGSRNRAPAMRTAALNCTAYGVALSAFAVSRLFWLTVACAVVVGYFYFSTTTILSTLVQQIVDEDKRGRVSSLFMLAWGGLVPLGTVVMGITARHVGAPETILGGALVVTAYAGWVAIRS